MAASYRKSRKPADPYLTITHAAIGWTYKVLKAWQNDPMKPYARVFCDVSSPYTFGGSDMGDTYTHEIRLATNPSMVTQYDTDLFDSAEDAYAALIGQSDYVPRS